jgi:hypothetical protein
MEDQPKKQTTDRTDSQPGQDNGNERNNHNAKHVAGNKNPKEDALDDTDKYLAMEQPGVKYTTDTDPTRNSDQADFGTESKKGLWTEEGGNSRNSSAFNQDDYILSDNIDLDEDQNQSISSDDDDFEESNERYTN